MAIKKEKKVEILKDLENIVKNESLVFVNFKKLTVLDATDLRRKLRQNGVGYKVTKKTLFKRAMTSRKLEGELPLLENQFAVAYGSDPILGAREVYDFQKTHKENIQIVGGVFEGKIVDKESMMAIATIPPIKVLYAQFVNLINSPIQRFAVALSEIAKSKE
jgi:large subunit ribosomal protein L10